MKPLHMYRPLDPHSTPARWHCDHILQIEMICTKTINMISPVVDIQEMLAEVEK